MREKFNPRETVRSIVAATPESRPLPESRLPLLVTGVSGVIGYNAFYHFARQYPGQVFGQRPVHNWPLQDDGLVPFNLEDHQAARQTIRDLGIRSILNCGGNCALKSCELDPAMAQVANVQGVDSLLEASDQDIRLVHISVDMVFSGWAARPYLENDPTDPVTVYGKTMVQAEQLVQKKRPTAAILRISLPMGVSSNGHAGAIDWIMSRFLADKPATLYYDEVRTPAYVQDLNCLFAGFIGSQTSGLFHAPGRRPVSLYQIAQVINRVGGFDPDLLIGCYRVEAGPVPPRAGNVTMDGTRLARFLANEKLADPRIVADDSELTEWPNRSDLFPSDRQWHYQRPESGVSIENIRQYLYSYSP